MSKGKRVLALITARGGSKRLPGKNLRPFRGKPLIGWTIEAALKSKIVDSVVVSTDSEEISKVSLQLGAQRVLSRPPELACDSTSSMDVVLDVLERLISPEERYDLVLILQPTSPLRTAHHIDDAFYFMQKKNATGVVGMCQTEHPLEWMTNLPMDSSISPFISQLLRRKGRTTASMSYQINGAIYLFDIPSLLKGGGLYGQTEIYGYIMDRAVSADIDTEIDFQIAEILSERIEPI